MYVDEKRPFWLVTVIQTAGLAVVAYFVALFVFVILQRIVLLPRGSIWDEASLRGPMLFLLIVVAFGVMMVPYFQKEWDTGSRTLSLFSAIFLFAYAVFHATGIIDPDIPMEMLVQHVIEPIRIKLGVP